MQENAQRDYYSDNLVAINGSNKVVARENIYNANGALLLAQGTEIHARSAERIIKHKLQKPLEDSISLEKLLSKDVLINQFKSMPSHPEVVTVFSKELSLDRFATECKQLEKHPIIVQKLTVLSMRFPQHYKKTLFGAYISLLICEERELPTETWHNVFIAAVSRDIGLIHIDPKVVSKETALTAEEWKLLQGHVAIGYQFLKNLPNINKEASRGVLEHHERTDGFGYPRNLTHEQLGEVGQILAFADMFIALFYKYVNNCGFTLADLGAIVQINSSIHLLENSQAALRILKGIASSQQRGPVVKDLAAQIERILTCQPKVEQWIELAKLLNNQLIKRENSPKLQRNLRLMKRVESVMVSSGVLDKALIRWLMSLETKNLSREAIAEVENFSLMLNEAVWQLSLIQKSFSVIMQQHEKKGWNVAAFVTTKSVLDALYAELDGGVLMKTKNS